MKICDFTRKELDFFREQANFTPDELAFFNLRAKDMSLIAVSMNMNISESKADVLSRKVKRKILKVL